MSGVLSIFNDGEKIMKNLFLLLKPKGKIFIFDSLNINSFNLYIKSEELKKIKKVYGIKICIVQNSLKLLQINLIRNAIFIPFD